MNLSDKAEAIDRLDNSITALALFKSTLELLIKRKPQASAQEVVEILGKEIESYRTQLEEVEGE